MSILRPFVDKVGCVTAVAQADASRLVCVGGPYGHYGLVRKKVLCWGAVVFKAVYKTKLRLSQPAKIFVCVYVYTSLCK